jgi:serine/threonine protein kinase
LEYENLKKLQEFQEFPKILYPHVYTYEKKRSSEKRFAIFTSWVDADLQHVISRNSPISFSIIEKKRTEQKCFFIKTLLRNLAALHNNQIVVRDLKLENIGLRTEGSNFVPIFFDTNAMNFNHEPLLWQQEPVVLWLPRFFNMKQE